MGDKGKNVLKNIVTIAYQSPEWLGFTNTLINSFYSMVSDGLLYYELYCFLIKVCLGFIKTF